MITITANIEALKNSEVKFIELIGELIKKSRLEDGCIEYTLYKNKDKVDSYIIIEKWESMESIEKHNKSEHFTRIIPRLGEFCLEDPKINLYEEIV